MHVSTVENILDHPSAKELGVKSNYSTNKRNSEREREEKSLNRTKISSPKQQENRDRDR